MPERLVLSVHECSPQGSEARRWQQLPTVERRRAVLSSFASYFGPRGGNPNAYADGAHFAPGVWTSYGHAL